jgi:hypothetical protein
MAQALHMVFEIKLLIIGFDDDELIKVLMDIHLWMMLQIVYLGHVLYIYLWQVF